MITLLENIFIKLYARLKLFLQNCVEICFHGNTCQNFLIFPPRNLEKNTGAYNTHAPFLKKLLFVNICLIFPPKDLEKIRRLKYACANYFFKNVINFKFRLNSIVGKCNLLFQCVFFL